MNNISHAKSTVVTDNSIIVQEWRDFYANKEIKESLSDKEIKLRTSRIISRLKNAYVELLELSDSNPKKQFNDASVSVKESLNLLKEVN